MTAKESELPLPPDDLMMAVSGHVRHEDFARSRHAGPRQFLKDLVDAGIDPGEIRDVLDFGCGAGRLLAGWVMAGTPWILRGCDYNPLLVDWCQANLPGVRMRINHMGQPLPYADGQFDLIYLISVFTHLTLAEQQRLVAEFYRVLRPGGLCYLSFHGAHYAPEMLPMVEDGAERFARDGFLIYQAEREGTNDCWTLHTVENLVSLCEPFTLVRHYDSSKRGPTDVAAWQDILILRKPDGSAANDEVIEGKQ